MQTGKINNTRLLRWIDEGRSQASIARAFKVSPQAISQRLQELRGHTTRAIISKKAGDVIDQKLDAMAQLTKINNYANELLDLCMRWQRGDDVALQILERQMRKIRIGKTEEFIGKVKFKDPRDIALRAMNEIRGQLRLQLEIFQTLFSVQAAEEFQKSILEAIGEVDPTVRNRIINKINAKREIRSAVTFK